MIPIPEGSEPGQYRVCTAPDSPYCAPLQITEGWQRTTTLGDDRCRPYSHESETVHDRRIFLAVQGGELPLCTGPNYCGEDAVSSGVERARILHRWASGECW